MDANYRDYLYSYSREAIAREAMKALISKTPVHEHNHNDHHFRDVARGAVSYADALLRELRR